MIAIVLSALGLLVGIGGLYLYENRSGQTYQWPAGTQGIGIVTPPGGNVSIGSNPGNTGLGGDAALGAVGGGLTGLASDLSGTAGAATAGAGVAVSLLAAFLAAHHAAAVKAEASALNNAVPHFEAGLQTVMKQVLARQISITDFDSAVNSLVNDYYTQVSKIIKGKWPNGPGVWPSNANEPNPCNGPCEVGHYWIEGHATPAKIVARQLLKGQIHTYTFSAVPAHAGFIGSPSWTVNA